MNSECLNPSFAYIVVEYENGVVKTKYEFPTKNLAKTFVKTMGKNFRYTGQNKKASQSSALSYGVKLGKCFIKYNM